MASLEGSGISRLASISYEVVISRWTLARLARLRTRWLRRYFADLGAGVKVSFQCRILSPEKISVGSRSNLPNSSVIDGRGGLVIGDDCLLGFENILLTSTHNSGDASVPIRLQGMYSSPIAIGDDVWTGCRVTVLPGVSIGSHAIVAAGAVVTTDVPEWAVVGGVPARVLRYRGDGAAAERLPSD